MEEGYRVSRLHCERKKRGGGQHPAAVWKEGYFDGIAGSPTVGLLVKQSPVCRKESPLNEICNVCDFASSISYNLPNGSYGRWGGDLPLAKESKETNHEIT